MEREIRRGGFFPRDFLVGFRESRSVYLDDVTCMKVVRMLCWGLVEAGASALQDVFRDTLKALEHPMVSGESNRGRVRG